MDSIFCPHVKQKQLLCLCTLQTRDPDCPLSTRSTSIDQAWAVWYFFFFSRIPQPGATNHAKRSLCYIPKSNTLWVSP